MQKAIISGLALGTGFLILLEIMKIHCQSIIITWGPVHGKQCVGRDQVSGPIELLVKDGQRNVEMH